MSKRVLSWAWLLLVLLASPAWAQQGVNVLGSVLPTGAASAANQATEITSLQLIDNLVLLEDAVAQTADPGVAALILQDSTPGNTAADGDYTVLQADSGLLWVRVRGLQTPNGDSVLDDTLDGVKVTNTTASTASAYLTVRLSDGSSFLTPSSDQTLDAAITTTGPLLVTRGSTATPTAMSTDGDATAVWTDLNGRLHLAAEAAEDTASADAQFGMRVFAIRDDTLDARSGTEGDFEWFHTNANGALWTLDVNSTAALTSLQLIDDAVFAEDAVHTTADKGLFVLGRRIDTVAASSNASGDYEAVNMNNVGAVWSAPVPSTNGGLSIYRSIDLDEGSGEVVKASAGQLYAMWVTNTATATRFIKIYDAASCTMGTGTPVITIGIPGNSSDDIAGNFGPGGMGIAFATGICAGSTTAVADADTGAPGTNDIIANFYYK